MSNSYYADSGYGFSHIDLKPEDSIPFEEIQRIIGLLESESLRAYFSSFDYEEFFDTDDLSDEEGQLIWELLLAYIRQEVDIPLQFCCDFDYNCHGRCLLIMDRSFNNPFSQNLSLDFVMRAMLNYQKMISTRLMPFEYITCITFG